MTTLPLVAPHLAGVVDLLEGDGILVTTEAPWPDGSGWQGAPGQSAFIGFCRVADASGQPPHGALDGVRSDRSFLFHIQSIGGSQAQATKLRDRVHALMVSGSLTVAGRELIGPAWMEQPGQTNPELDTDPAVYVGWDQYAVWTTPA